MYNKKKKKKIAEMPKYFRINTLLKSKEQVFDELIKMGYRITKPPNPEEYLQENSQEKQENSQVNQQENQQEENNEENNEENEEEEK